MDKYLGLINLEELTLESLRYQSGLFKTYISSQRFTELYGATDGKAIGTFVEHKFYDFLKRNYSFIQGSSANGIDFPSIKVDIKVTRHTQPQSSCPFKSARQKIYGLGYNILLFVYDKIDHDGSARLNILDNVFIDKNRTADFQLTSLLRQALNNKANEDDLIAIMQDRNLPVDDIEMTNLAHEILVNKPPQGYLTISNALQWRLQYGRVISEAGQVDGIYKLE